MSFAVTSAIFWKSQKEGEVNNETGSTTTPGSMHTLAQLVCAMYNIYASKQRLKRRWKVLKKCTQACAMQEGSRNHANLCQKSSKAKNEAQESLPSCTDVLRFVYTN